MENEFISKWVRVSERTPISIDEVVIMDADHNNYLGIGSYSSENGWAIQGNFYWKPTHWLELLPTNKIGQQYTRLHQNKFCGVMNF